MEQTEQTFRLPIVALRNMTIFPNMVISFPVGRDASLYAVEAVENTTKLLFLITQKHPNVDEPREEDLYRVGTVARLNQVLRLPGGSVHIIVEGVERAKMESLEEGALFHTAQVSSLPQDNATETTLEEKAMMKIALEYFERYGKYRNNTLFPDAMVNAAAAEKPGLLADIICSVLDVYPEKRQMLLEELNPMKRLEEVVMSLQEELQVLKLKKEIESKTKKAMDQEQKEYYLREQIKVIREELGDRDDIDRSADQFLEKLKEKNPPQLVADTLKKEIDRLRRIPPSSPESNVSYNYIETLLSLPWREETKDNIDLKEVKEILDADHYGLQKVKERIVEFLAVRKAAPQENASILCLVGPPGVGKTSIARSIARAMGRNYVRMSLGGIKDEAEIRGHRKTYIGAMPGRIIQAIRQAGTTNPLVLLDEVDKLCTSFNGDPAAALLEVLDSEQNHTFRDHFVELPYDLSKVLFICTANTTDTISQPLLDRMEIISLDSYTAEEKYHIAAEHLLPKQRKKHGLQPAELSIRKEGMEAIIDGYTKEAGVRKLEQQIAAVCRKAVKEILTGEKKRIVVTEKNLEHYLGIRLYETDQIYEEDQVGIVRGLAWTQMGGTTLSIEVNVMPGDGKLLLTGNLGDVMKESARAALSAIRSGSERYTLAKDFYKKQDIHIHIPEGAVPKDGPSAGVTMAVAMLSALTGRKVRRDVAMTGEITIRGRILPIGGLTEKTLAAKKAGVKTVLFPKENEKQMAEVPKQIKEGLELVPITTLDEALHWALAKGESVWK